jgi:hypothetical protein
LKSELWLGVVVLAWNLSTEEEEEAAGLSLKSAWTRETLSKKSKNKRTTTKQTVTILYYSLLYM